MCGISGIMTGDTRHSFADDFIKDSFVAGSLRGMDSSGVVNIEMDKSLFAWQKLPVMGSMFITDKAAANIFRDANLPKSLTLAHTRAATTGSVTMNNAHPFIAEGADGKDYRELVGVHNGSLTNWKSKKQANAYDVDSDWALNHIFNNGMSAFEDFEGAYCFVWWDSADKEVLNIALNDKRPMHIAFLEKGGMAFASEAGMLAWLLERNNVARTGNILVLEAGQKYSFDVNKPTEFTKEKIPARKVITPIYTNNSSTIAQLDKIFAKVRDTTTPFLTKDEIDRAAMEGMQGMRGKFVPSYFDASLAELYGNIAIVFDGEVQEMFATIRKAGNIKWTADTVFDLQVLGVSDDTTSTIICSYPVTAIRSVA